MKSKTYLWRVGCAAFVNVAFLGTNEENEPIFGVEFDARSTRFGRRILVTRGALVQLFVEQN